VNQRSHAAWRTSLTVAAFVALAGCGSSNSLAPFQPQITNAADNFQMQATNVANVTTTLSYSWTNTGTQATINHSTTTTAGTTLLVIKDNAGTTVYNHVLSPSLNEPTTAGQAGTWNIAVTFTGYSGTINFRAQKL
jgi:hypothetical protein